MATARLHDQAIQDSSKSVRRPLGVDARSENRLDGRIVGCRHLGASLFVLRSWRRGNSRNARGPFS